MVREVALILVTSHQPSNLKPRLTLLLYRGWHYATTNIDFI